MEDFIAWIVIGVLGFLAIAFLGKYLITKLHYFSGMDFDQVLQKRVKIPVGDIDLHGILVIPKYALGIDGKPREKLPLLFFSYAWKVSSEIVRAMQYIVALACGGPYAILAYDCRGFGKSPGKRRYGTEVFNDIPRVFDFGAKLDEIDPNRLGFFGFSFGGHVGLIQAYKEERIKAIVALGALHNVQGNYLRKNEPLRVRFFLGFLHVLGVKVRHLSKEENDSISPEFNIDPQREDLNKRIFLMHTRNDSVISYSEYEKNRTVLKLPENQLLSLRTGGHLFFHQECLIVANALRFYKSLL